jgi:hypothetical protein
LNSFTVDWLVRAKVTSHLNFFAVYQLPISRLTERDPSFQPLMMRAAKLICVSSEFDALAKEAGLTGFDKVLSTRVNAVKSGQKSMESSLTFTG